MKKTIRLLGKSDLFVIIFSILSSAIMVCLPIVTIKGVDFIVKKNFKMFFIVAFIHFALYVLFVSYNYFFNRFKLKIIENNIMDLKNEIIKRFSNENISIIDSDNTGKYLSLLINDTESIKKLFYENVYSLFYNIFMLILSCMYLYIISKYLLLFVIVTSFAIIYLPKKYMQLINNKNVEISKYSEVYTNKLLNFYKGISIFVFNNSGEKYVEKINEITNDIINKKIKLGKLTSIYTFNIEMLQSFGIVLIKLFCIFLVYINKITVGVLISIANIYMNILNSLKGISTNILNINSGIKIFEKFDDTGILKKHKNKDNKISGDIYKIEYKNISVTREDKLIINNFNKIIEHGKKYAIVGESGAGKSTLVNLLLGYIENYEGQVLINDIDIKDISRESLFKNISYVNSDNNIFLTNIVENINLYGSIENKDIYNIIETLKLDDIEKEKELDETNISTGQKQRINIARALLSDKQLIILDEATSNIDAENRKIIEDKILRNNDKTVIMITHHLDESLRAEFDEIIEVKYLKFKDK